jgi:CheY-like chemotaxis protein
LATQAREPDDEPLATAIEPDRGSALRLSVVRGIVRSYSGDIVASTLSDRGAKYEVYLPTFSRQSRDESAAPDPETLTGSERILLVDDEPKFVMVTQKQLEHLGYHVNIHTSPVSALERFKAAPGDFDLVISDVAMPKMTGDKLVNHIRLLRPDIPVILCTGYSNKVDKEMATQLGCAYIIKPVERDRLARLVRETLDHVPAIGPL